MKRPNPNTLWGMEEWENGLSIDILNYTASFSAFLIVAPLFIYILMSNFSII